MTPQESLIQQLFQNICAPSHTKQAFVSLLNNIVQAVFQESQLKDALSIVLHEILQNADDALYGVTNSKVEILLLDSYLVFKHNGAAFDTNDIQALCSINNSTKIQNANKIGYKGIGFKSVFSVSDWVYLFSNGYSIRFDKKDASVSSEPWQIAPIWTDISILPEILQKALGISEINGEAKISHSVFIAINLEQLMNQENEKKIDTDNDMAIPQDSTNAILETIKTIFIELFWEKYEHLLFLNNIEEIYISNQSQQANKSVKAVITRGQNQSHSITLSRNANPNQQKNTQTKKQAYWYLHKQLVVMSDSIKNRLNARKESIFV